MGEHSAFGPKPGQHRDDCAWTLRRNTCSCEYPRYLEAIEAIANDFIRRALEAALEDETPGWEDYPELPAFVWDDVRDRARRLGGSRVDVQSSASTAYTALAALASEEAW